MNMLITGHQNYQSFACEREIESGWGANGLARAFGLGNTLTAVNSLLRILLRVRHLD